MITADGWIDWAERLPGPVAHTNPGKNPVRGIFMHSAEGYAGTLLDPNSIYGYNGSHSWHLSNLFNGRLVQHYPLTARCWHATAANDGYVGVENEGDWPKELTLTQKQIDNAVHFTKDISEWKSWTPTRTGNTAQTLWEHNEVVWLGGSATSCPSGRIPWDKILAGLNPEIPVVVKDDDMKTHYAWSAWHEGLEFEGSDTRWGANLRHDFSLPAEAKSVLIQPTFRRGSAEFYHADSEVVAVNFGNALLVILDENGSCHFRTLGTKMQFERLQCIGYYV